MTESLPSNLTLIIPIGTQIVIRVEIKGDYKSTTLVTAARNAIR